MPKRGYAYFRNQGESWITMTAKKFRCTLQNIQWLTPNVMEVTFHTHKKLKFQGGQFLSIFVPNLVTGKITKRAYSFSSDPNSSEIQLCVKYLPGGAGSEFLKSLRPGDTFFANAPYGHFVFQENHNPNACFISTSTGVAPFRSMVQSELFQENLPKNSLFLHGARTENEIIYPGFFEGLGFQTVNAVSRPSPNYAGFHGRVSDYLKQLPNAWIWHNTDFYICGSGEMTHDVCEILTGGHGVPPKNIFHENFSLKKKAA
jgi:ferredoxin-NADP reductase